LPAIPLNQNSVGQDRACNDRKNGSDLAFSQPFDDYYCQPWNKSVIVFDLEGSHLFNHSLARMVAGAVEEKVLKMECHQIITSLIKEFVRCEMWQFQKAQAALEDSNASEFLAPIDPDIDQRDQIPVPMEFSSTL